MPTGEVEFVDAAPAPPPPPVRPTHRGRWALLAVTALAGLITWIVAAPHAAHRPDATSTISAPTPNPASACPFRVRCGYDTAVPRPVAALVRHYLPGAATDTAYTVLRYTSPGSGGALWFREVRAHLGDVRVDVVVQASAARVAHIARPKHHHIGYARVDMAGYTVQVTLVGPTTWDPQMTPISALAGDERLTEL